METLFKGMLILCATVEVVIGLLSYWKTHSTSRFTSVAWLFGK